jgi:hypothetical protein
MSKTVEFGKKHKEFYGLTSMVHLFFAMFLVIVKKLLFAEANSLIFLKKSKDF